MDHRTNKSDPSSYFFHGKTSEPLHELKSRHFKQLRDVYRKNFPYGADGYCLLDMLIRNCGIVNSFNFTVYCPNGSMNKGMIAVSNTETYQVYICPMREDNVNCLEECLVRTRVIDWTNNIIVPSVMPDVMRMIDRVAGVLKLDVKCNGYVVKYLKSQDTQQFDDCMPPEGTYVGPLKCEHLSLIDASWPFHSDTSYDYFKRLLDNNLFYVLYSQCTNQPLAWVCVDETGALSHLYSVEQCRRLGYASYITKVASNNLLSYGQHVLAYSLMDNFASQRFFIKLGFRNLGVSSWLLLTRKLVNIPSCAYCRLVEFHPTPNTSGD